MPGDLDNAPTVENTVSLFDRETVDRLETTGFAVEDAAAPREVVDPVDRYDLLDELARGGMGVVHLATDRMIGRPVAIKILQERYKTGSAAARRFVDEARITGQLQHPGIPPIHDLGTLPDGRPFLAMKLVKGGPSTTSSRIGPGPTSTGAGSSPPSSRSARRSGTPTPTRSSTATSSPRTS